MTKKKPTKKQKEKNIKPLIIALIVIVVGMATGAGVKIKIDNDNLTATIEYAEETVAPEITEENGLGEINLEEEIPTVEAVENNMPVVETGEEECPEGEECGRGASYPKLNVSSPQAFANDTLGKCINVDGFAGAQCWDLASAFFYNYAGRELTTCGTGAAKGTIENDCWKKNAGNEFVMIWDAKQVQAGDIAVYSTGRWGHVGMAMGRYNNGYFTLLGQNQGGKACEGGGSATNIINLSTRDFIGAFRPKAYIKPEPKPEPKPTPKPTPKNPDTSIIK